MNWFALSGLLTSINALGMGMLSVAKGRRFLHRIWALFNFSVALWGFGAYKFSTTRDEPSVFLWLGIAHIGVILIPLFYLHFVLELLEVRKQRILAMTYLVGAFFFVINLTDFFDLTNLFIVHLQFVFNSFYVDSPPGLLYPFFVAFFFLTVSYGAYCATKVYRVSIGLKRAQIKYFIWATLLGFSGGGTAFLMVFNIDVYPFLHFGVALYPILLSYAIIRYRFVDITLAVTRTAVFAAVYTAVLGIPLWYALVWQSRLEILIGNRWWVWVLLVYAALATAAHYANMFFQRRAEARLMAEQRRYQSVLRQASQGMTLIKDLGKLLRLIVHLLTQKVRIRHAGIYLWDVRLKQFVPKVSRQWKVKEPPTFARNHPLVEYLYWNRKPVVTEELTLQARGGAKELQPVVAGLKELDAAVLVPSFTEEDCEGFLVLGDKRSGALFTSDDLEVFQVLASQSALAIENAQFYEELKRTQADLFQTAKMASLGHMAGGMSHQINNRFHVLTILAGTLKSVMKDTDPAGMEREKLRELWQKALETLSKLEDNALRGGDIVKTLLRFSRPAGEYKAVTVQQILSTAREVAQFRVNMAAIDYTEEIPGDIPPVKGDLNQLADCCFNLITNAYDAVQKKATLIQEKQISPASDDPVPFRGKLWIRAFLEKKEGKGVVVVELQDNGTGMMPQELDNLFVPFFTTKATAQKGTGLGLYVIHRIVEQHGGKIAVASKLGVGTTFTMRLPLFEQEPAHA